MLKRLFASAVIVLFAGQANAQFVMGNDLIDELREVDKYNMGHLRGVDFGRLNYYSGFVAGVYDAYAWAGSLCGTDHVTQGQAQAIVSRYFKAHPTEWHLPAVELARNALQSAFPCPK